MVKKRHKTTPRSRLPRSTEALPAPEPMDVTEQKARKLPMFGPGIVITVPLHLWPAYAKLYSLTPKGMSATGTLIVKREVADGHP